MKAKLLIFSLALVLLPLSAQAQNANDDASCKILSDQFIQFAGFGDAMIGNGSTNVTNVANSIYGSVPHKCSVEDIAITVIKLGLTLAATAAIIFIIIGGFQIIMGGRGGESEGVSKGKKTLTYAIIGLIVVLLANVIVTAISKFVINGGKL